MGQQRLHQALAPIDVLTRLDVEEMLNTRMDSFIRDWYRGEIFMEVNGNVLAGQTQFTINGPVSGCSWSLKTLSVVVNGLASTTPAVNALVLGASPSTSYNNNSVGVNVTVTGGTVSAITVNGTNTGATSGTFFVPAGGTIGVTYTVAPSFTTAGIAVTSSPFVTIFEGDNTQLAPLGTTQVVNGAAVYQWGSNSAVIKDQRNLTVITTAGTFGNYKLTLKQVPSEMEGKL